MKVKITPPSQLTSFRLNNELRQRIIKIGGLGNNFSRSLNKIIALGFDRFEETRWNSLMNVDSERDIRFIAQRHEQGIPLSITEIHYVFQRVRAAFQGKIFLHPETVVSMNDLFIDCLKSRCFSSGLSTFFLFKEIGILEKDYDSFHEEIDQVILNLKTDAHKICFSEISTVKHMADKIHFLTSVCDPKESHLTEVNIFKECVVPYLTSLIQIAKWQLGYQLRQKVVHSVNAQIFYRQRQIEPKVMLESEQHAISIFCGNYLSTKASLHLKSKGAEFCIGFYELDDLLKIGGVLHQPQPHFTKNVNDGFKIEGTLRVDLLKNGADLFIGSSRYTFSSQEWADFGSLLLKVENEYGEKLKALRYQLGSC